MNACLPKIGFNNRLIKIGGGRPLSYNQSLTIESVEPFSYDIFTFTADGEHLLMKTPTDPFPGDHYIVDFLLGSKIGNQGSDKGSERKVEPVGESLAALISYATGKPSPDPEKVLTNNGVVTIGNRASGVVTSNSGKAVTITPLTTGSSLSTRGDDFTLTRLPNWSGSTNINPSIIGPSKEGESLKVVLDQAARTRNDLSQIMDTNRDRGAVLSLPLIIEPSVTAIEQMNQLSIGSSSRAALFDDDGTFDERLE